MQQRSHNLECLGQKKDHKNYGGETQQLRTLLQSDGTYNSFEVKNLDEEISAMLASDDLKQRQRTKQHWYQLRDKNTKYFHQSATQRRKKNKIAAIQSEQGQVAKNWAKIEEVFRQYFQNLFQSSHPLDGQIEKCTNLVDPCVTPAIDDFLEAPFKPEEVQAALQQMSPLKSPGLDMFSATFFQSYWQIVGVDVCKGVLQFLNEGYSDEKLNYTYIFLIPKTKNPSQPKDYRPISLCNVVHKLA